MIENLPVNVEQIRDGGLIPGLGRSPGGGHGSGESHEQRSLVRYGPWSRRVGHN